MPGGLTPLAVAAFAGAVGALIALGLAAISLVLRAQRKHRRRLNRVGRRRISGRIEIDDVRQSLIRAQENTSALEALTVRLAGVIPVLDTARLQANITRAGMTMSISTFALTSALVAFGFAGVATLITGAPFAALMVPGLFAGMYVVNAFVRLRGQTMANRFMKQLPEAIDTIIRGIRSGLPVIECIGTAGQESPAPLGPHFRMISERVQVGEPLETALWRVAKVVDKPEMDFLAVAISIQMETGGSLSEALGNLADLLRRREHMKLKIKAVSSEAKASALIIGALPFVMLGLLTVMSPDYVLPLFTDPRGRLMLAAGMGSILVGAFVMWRMTQFEI